MLSDKDYQSIFQSTVTRSISSRQPHQMNNEAIFIKAMEVFTAHRDTAYSVANTFLLNSIEDFSRYVTENIAVPRLVGIGDDSWVWVEKDAVVILSGWGTNAQYFAVSFRKDLIENLEKKAKELSDAFKPEDDRSVYALVKGSHGAVMSAIDAVNKPLERGNYTGSQLEKYDVVVEEFGK